MGILAEIVGISQEMNRKAERATPEKVLALAVHNEEQQEKAKKGGKKK